MDINDALSICALTENELTGKVADLWSRLYPSAIINDSSYRGFIVRKDGSADIFYMLSVDEAGAGSYSKLIAYNSAAEKIRCVFEGDGVIPGEELDSMKPALKHNRKDQ